MRLLRLVEFSTPRRDEMGRLDQASDKVIEHLVKIWMFPGYRSTKTWTDELWKFLHKTRKVKKGGYLPAKDIYQTTWLDNMGSVRPYCETYADFHADGEFPVPMRSDYENRYDELYRIMGTYFRELSDALSENGTISVSDVRGFVRDSGILDTRR